MLGRALSTLGIEPRHTTRFRLRTKVEVLRFYGLPVRQHLGYVLTDPELQNFTYELENEAELADWIAATFGADRGEVCSYLLEARSDQLIYEPLRRATAPWWNKSAPPIGRRLGWYAIARVLKPTRVIETGIFDGLGSLVFLAALDRNARDGVNGTLVSFDIDPDAGWIVGQHPRWSRRIGDSRQTLGAALAEGPFQLFLHDSLHTYEHEAFELETAVANIDPGGVLLSDNSHATTALHDVAERHGLPYAFWRERPRSHFYPGGGIGAALMDPRAA